MMESLESCGTLWSNLGLDDTVLMKATCTVLVPMSLVQVIHTRYKHVLGFGALF